MRSIFLTVLLGVYVVQSRAVAQTQDALNVERGTSYVPSRTAVINQSGSLDGAQGHLEDCVMVSGYAVRCGVQTGDSLQGTPDGANRNFTVSARPDAETLQVFRNGILMSAPND